MYPVQQAHLRFEVTLMADSSNTDTPDTYFASPERAETDVLWVVRQDFIASHVAVHLLDAVPEPAMVLYETRQIIIANSTLLSMLGMKGIDEMIGMRPGELLSCIHADEMPAGCGTSKACRYCGAGQAIVECLVRGKIAGQECRISTNGDKDGGALDVYVQVTPVKAGDHEYAVLHMRDISADRRRAVLERIFLHDLTNAAFGLRSIAESLRNRSSGPEADKELREFLYRAAVQISDELSAHRQLLLAERGDLTPQFGKVRVADVLEAVETIYRYNDLAMSKQIRVVRAPDVQIITDAVLLQRVLSNLVKNALEATPSGGTVSIAAYDRGENLDLVVTNPGVMPEEVQEQIYQRSFSTKDGIGRGIGTYCVKLIGERYLQGSVSFTSADPDGTQFTISLPKRPSVGI